MYLLLLPRRLCQNREITAKVSDFPYVPTDIDSLPSQNKILGEFCRFPLTILPGVCYSADVAIFCEIL